MTITIIENATNESKYVLPDDSVYNIKETSMETRDFIIGDLGSSNSTIVKDVTPPSDWTGGKYTYIDGTWAINPNFEEPPE
tara:strand:- start:568 stop:810 length:243 start_codon:yes stop_codon:yes gene_type:complete